MRTGTRWRAAALATALVTTVAGCAEPESATWVPAQGQPSAAASPSAPPRLPRVTSACKVLTGKAIIDLLGGTSTTKLTAREDGVDDLGAGAKRYTCGYGRGGTEPFALTVTERPDQGDTAAEAIDLIVDYADKDAKRITGLGDGIDGVTYLKGAFRGTAIAVPYEDKLRIAVFISPPQIPRGKLIEVAEHLVTRL
jgi:hypothetical protein